MNINELMKQSFKIASEHGWHDKELNFGECLANIHAEVSEAWEDYRAGYKPDDYNYVCTDEKKHGCEKYSDCDSCESYKPCGIPSEFADIIIRMLDCCAYYKIDIETAIKEKMEYNEKRPYKHGGKIV